MDKAAKNMFLQMGGTLVRKRTQPNGEPIIVVRDKKSDWHKLRTAPKFNNNFERNNYYNGLVELDNVEAD
jgi:hypothetical protein